MKQRRGFACMDPERRRQIAKVGGQTAQAIGRAHRWTSEEARMAGSKGGRASHAAKTKERINVVVVVKE